MLPHFPLSVGPPNDWNHHSLIGAGIVHFSFVHYQHHIVTVMVGLHLFLFSLLWINHFNCTTGFHIGHQRRPHRKFQTIGASIDSSTQLSTPRIRLRSTNQGDCQGVTNLVVDEFVREIKHSIESEDFVSLVFRGAKKQKSKSDFEAVRGSIRVVHGRLIAIKSGTCLQLTLKYHGATDICRNIQTSEIEERLRSFILDPIPSEWGIEAVQALPIQGAQLTTLSSEWEMILRRNNDGKSTLKQKKVNSGNSVVPSIASHDRVKETPVARATPFFQALGLTNSNGKIKPGMSSKVRQCNKFVEIVSGLVRKSLSDGIEKANDVKLRQAINVMDMGCGRGYLTFALHHHLSENFESVSSVGIDIRPKLVKEINGISKSLGGHFESLSFEEGSIESVVRGSQHARSHTDKKGNRRSLDILIALHACDTATDDALWAGIARGADILVVAPCCHKQVRPQLNAHVSEEKDAHPLYDTLKYGVYRDRLSETATDSMRAILLEMAGYSVQVFEFIGGEHTSKNVMISAVKGRKEPNLKELGERLGKVSSMYGIKKQKLAKWMGYSLDGLAVSETTVGATQMPVRKLVR